jgi:hypothetical protein
MTKEFKKDLKAIGYKNPIVKYMRLDTHSIAYDIRVDEKYEGNSWEGHYFVGETGSKEAMIEDWKETLKDIEPNDT